MDELLQQVMTVLRATWQRRWIGLGVAWAVAVIGAVVLWRMPDRYEATARIYVDTQSVLKPLMAGLAVQPNVEQQVNMLARTLISRPNIEKLMRNADLDLLVSTPQQKEQLIDALTAAIKLSNDVRGNNLYHISYRDTDPERAKRVVQSLVSMFVESGLGDKRRDAESARKFIEEQIKNYEKKLEEAENRMRDFRLKHFSVTGDASQGYMARLSSLSDELAKTRLELSAAEQSRDALKREVTDEEPVLVPDVPPAGAPSVVPELDARIETQKKQLDELLRRYTDQHPDVQSTRRLIAQLEAQKKQEIEALRKAAAKQSAPKYSAATNPVYQRLKIAQAEAEANVAALRGRVTELTSRIAQMRAKAEEVPKVETEMTQMNRDYEILRKNYEQLVARRESASLSEDVDATSRVADFRLIDPPRVSPKPVFPDRMALVPLVLVISLAAGVFASFAVSQILATVQDGKMLRLITNRPVLGSISMVLDDATIHRGRILNTAFGSGIAGLILVYGSWVAWIWWMAHRG